MVPVVDPQTCSPEEVEFRRAIDAVLSSTSSKKLVVAGPGTGKTTLFKKVLERLPGEASERVVLTFINALKDDLEKDLSDLAGVHTLHSFCLGLLHRDPVLRSSLTEAFRVCPGLAGLIAKDWELIVGTKPPKFVAQMRNLVTDEDLDFYLSRGSYYDAVDFDDCVYRAYSGFVSHGASPPGSELVLIDEYQDFNALEAGVIDVLGSGSPLLVAGDDDQALYSQLRDASCEYIRGLRLAGNFEVFSLPFCMRCPQVIVDAVGDIVQGARRRGLLDGRISKPYKHYPPVKGADSRTYPLIIDVQTSVQSAKANYMGRCIEQRIKAISADEIAEAAKGGYPAALVIVAKPYREQIADHLRNNGYVVDGARQTQAGVDRAAGLELLNENSRSNLGWRIVMEVDQPKFMSDIICASAGLTTDLVDVIPSAYAATILMEAALTQSDAVPSSSEGGSDADQELPPIKVTSFEGAKGLSAGHVFIAGLHDGELPHNPSDIKDLEVCKFIVGLTRTRKQCTLIHCSHFGAGWKKPSSFISWIRQDRLQSVTVDKSYWNAGSAGRPARS